MQEAYLLCPPSHPTAPLTSLTKYKFKGDIVKDFRMPTADQ
jgi:hypothetical protein